jgi:hypothetical protein
VRWDSPENAFKVPPNWRRAQVEIEKELLQRRRKERSLPVYMKNSYVTRSMGNNLPRIRRELKGIEFSKEHTEPIIDEMNRKDIKNQKHLSLKQMVVQERDIFMVKFATKAKRDEIEQIQTEIHLENKRVDDMETRVTREYEQFDEFIRLTNQTAVEAVLSAEVETKKREKMMIPINELVGSTHAVRAELCKIEDRLAELLHLKKFFYLLNYNRAATDDILTIGKYTLPKDAPIAIPFKDPSEITAMIEDFENRNLSLIGHYQHSEEELDGVKKSHQRTVNNYDRQLSLLKDHLTVIQTTLDRFLERGAELELCCQMFSSFEEASNQDDILTQFDTKIKKVYSKTVGSLDIDMQVDPLIMLTSIENRLEELIEQEETLQGSTVREAQKELEKLRRQHAREEKQRQLEQKHKERAQRAKERSNQIFLKRGRKLVQRSRPHQMKVKKEVQLLIDESERDREFFEYT